MKTFQENDIQRKKFMRVYLTITVITFIQALFFFSYAPFYDWNMHHASIEDRFGKSRFDHKKAMKDYIFEFDKDESYRYKLKTQSVGNQYPTSILFLEGQNMLQRVGVLPHAVYFRICVLLYLNHINFVLKNQKIF